jgi:hypothetical protein
MQRLAIVAIAGLLALTLVEGLASLVITAGLYFGPSSRFAQDVYSRYDPELGWVALPNVALPDMWGPGIGLYTDSHGFRGRRETPEAPPADKLRVVCSGDSFTFGSGVADEATWCAVLEALDTRIESINLGQGGYGVDQAFLRFRRDGARFHPKLHVFAFIDADLDRMRSNRFIDYGKPTLALRDGTLTVENVPAPSVRWWAPSIRTVEIVHRTKASELLDRLRRHFGGGPALVGAATTDPPYDIVATALAAIDELKDLAKKDAGRLIVVRLPTAGDCQGVQPAVDWWKTLASELSQREILGLDLTKQCRTQPASKLDTFFIPQNEARYWGGAGHYTVAGNRFFADALLGEIRPLIDALVRARRN